MVVIDVFAHHDGVIHHDSQGDDKGKHGDQIDADSEDRQNEKRAEKGYGYAKANPEGETGLEKNGQKNEHQTETKVAVGQH